MIVWWFITLLIAKSNPACFKTKIKSWSPTDCEAGRSFFAKLNITEISTPYLYPWLSEVRVNHPEFTKACSGALINDRYVLSTQSCIYPPVLPHHVTVHLGFYNGYDKDVSDLLQPKVLVKNASALNLYPNYDPNNPTTRGNDLVLIKLETPVSYSKTIYPIHLPSLGDQFLDYGDRNGHITEWVFYQNEVGYTKELKENSVKILNECGNHDDYYRQVIPNNVLCAVDYSNITDSCVNGMGGLLTIPSHHGLYDITLLIGIFSRISPNINYCSNPEIPRVYIRIDRKLSWIKENTNDGLYCRF